MSLLLTIAVQVNIISLQNMLDQRDCNMAWALEAYQRAGMDLMLSDVEMTSKLFDEDITFYSTFDRIKALEGFVRQCKGDRSIKRYYKKYESSFW
ncbi:hypothetical protein KGM_213308 [Danaus plexippus plexippus]|uniref:Uncharacterized protein n=1 Tax=Danaus plexippus plexippus TaxID=278856 RepID=A0A212FLQ8_DANPL|nr:hypothetical protein KGM_213308 [Danaus plexippus plexippus]